jgi:exodeoxyribonuclease VII large subunit
LVLAVRRRLDNVLSTVRQALRLLGDPRRRLGQAGQRVDELAARLVTGLRHHVRRDRSRLMALAGALDHLNPLAILSRGYSVTRLLPAGTILKDAGVVKAGDRISTRLHAGEIVSQVEKTE